MGGRATGNVYASLDGTPTAAGPGAQAALADHTAAGGAPQGYAELGGGPDAAGPPGYAKLGGGVTAAAESHAYARLAGSPAATAPQETRPAYDTLNPPKGSAREQPVYNVLTQPKP